MNIRFIEARNTKDQIFFINVSAIKYMTNTDNNRCLIMVSNDEVFYIDNKNVEELARDLS